MTEENYLYRTSPLTLRNQFPGMGHWKIPVVPKAHFSDDEFQDLRLIGYDRTKPDDERHLDGWFISFSTNTNLSEYGNTRIRTWKS